MSCHQLWTCHTNDWGNAGSSDNGNIHLSPLWRCCTCIPLHSVFCCLPPTWLLFSMTMNVSMRMQPIYHPFFLKGTLTAVNGCNKTRTIESLPCLLCSVFLKVDPIVTKQNQKIPSEKQIIFYTHNLKYFVLLAHAINMNYTLKKDVNEN